MWEPSNALLLSTSAEDFPVWRSQLCTIQEFREPFEFKFIITNAHGQAVAWEDRGNRKMTWQEFEKLPDHDNMNNIAVCSSFGCQDLTVSKTPIASQTAQLQKEKNNLDHSKNETKVYNVNSNQQNKAITQESQDVFQHKLSSAPDVIMPLLKGNDSARSFLQKLQLVESLLPELEKLVNDTILSEQGIETLTTMLSAICVYLTFIRSGVIECKEDGRHFRPNHHAAAASLIFHTLISIIQRLYTIENNKLKSRKDVAILLIRRILPLLPSFSESFTCSVPLTRIRDIAHRNDIPQDLKNEIKHTLQNKLHRCAGPEDLVTTERLVHRLVNNRQNYSQDFVSEFLKFHEELKEFFNARSLNDQLDIIKQQNIDNRLVKEIHAFLSAKQCATEKNLESLIVVLKHSVNIRSLLNTSRSNQQNIWLVDIALSDYAFVLLSQAINPLDEGISWGDLKLTDLRWGLGLQALLYGIQHIQLNSFAKLEAESIKTSLEFILEIWNHLYGGQSSTNLNNIIPFNTNEFGLFLKSVLERCRLLTEDYTHTILCLFSPVILYAGEAFHIPRHAIDVFAEADIRASVIFQISRLSSALLYHLEAELGYSGIDIIVGPSPQSRIVGKIIQIPTLAQLSSEAMKAQRKQRTTPLLLFLEHASGDEEILGLYSKFGVVAIIVMHGIPHLSHLSIRARDVGLPLLAAVNPQSLLLNQAKNHLGEYMELLFGTEVTLAEINLRKASFLRLDSGNIPFLQNTLSPDINKDLLDRISDSASLNTDVSTDATGSFPILSNESITLELCGSKSFVCAQLQKLSGDSSGLFQTPTCWVLPFGTMEAVIKMTGTFDVYETLLDQLNQLSSLPSDEDQLNQALESLHAFMLNIIPTKDHLNLLCNDIAVYAKKLNVEKSNMKFIIRSSANVEDLEGMSAAGLYESIANTNPFNNMNSFAKAISAVWTSLHSRRAVISRKIAGIPQNVARMAVLIQNLINPYMAFVIHTHCPLLNSVLSESMRHKRQLRKAITSEKSDSSSLKPMDWIYVELALGFGEILASGATPGSAHRMIIHKRNGEFSMLNFANFPIEFIPVNETLQHNRNPCGENDGDASNHFSATEFVETRVTNYMKDIFTLNPLAREMIANKLRCVSIQLENEYGCPQDIEGSFNFTEDMKNIILNSERDQLCSLNIEDRHIIISIVQSRPQTI